MTLPSDLNILTFSTFSSSGFLFFLEVYSVCYGTHQVGAKRESWSFPPGGIMISEITM
jgi:hypothetical protein